MFIKLTRLDGSPIWLNAGFVVTVEPRKQGGSIVVPVGDGLDYDVRETPEAVLALLARAPDPVVVPVPTKDALTATPEDLSPDDGTTVNKDGEIVAKVEAEPPAEEKKPSKRRPRRRKKHPTAAPQPGAAQPTPPPPATI